MSRRAAASSGTAWAARILVLVVLSLGAMGCSAGYVARAAYEEARILWRRQDIEQKIAEPDLPPTTKRKLELVLEVRSFAAERLGFRVGGSFRTVSEVDGGAVVHLLTAARRDRLEPKTWWFPIVGRVPYRGYFSERAATATAAELERQEYDTYVRPAIAFSTLGWFDDPLPSPLLKHDEVTLAQVIFHELLHNTLFLPGETTFDESMATFAGYRAAIEFFCEGDGATSERCRTATADWQDTLTISQFFARGLAALESFYDSKPSGAALEEGRQRAFAEMRESFRALKLQPGRNADFAAGPINNASLIQERIYLKDLDVFEQLYHRAGGLRGAVDEIRKAVDRGGNPFDRVREAAETKSLVDLPRRPHRDAQVSVLTSMVQSDRGSGAQARRSRTDAVASAVELIRTGRNRRDAYRGRQYNGPRRGSSVDHPVASVQDQPVHVVGRGRNSDLIVVARGDRLCACQAQVRRQLAARVV